MHNSDFDYEEAFSRNIGLLTKIEQEQLRDVTIALCGSQAVLETYLVALVRQGFQKFKVIEIGDPQFTTTAGLDEHIHKDTMALKDEIRGINPDCEVTFFSYHESRDVLREYLNEVRLTIDAIDTAQTAARRAIYTESLQQHIPVLGAESDPFGITYYVFMPGGPTFDECFSSERELRSATQPIVKLYNRLRRFCTRSMQVHSVPTLKDCSTLVGTLNLRVGIVVIYALKILLCRGPIKAMPHYHQYDVFGEQYGVRQLRWSKSGLWHRLKRGLRAHHR